MKRSVRDDVAVQWRKYRKTRCEELRNRIVERYVPLVNKVAEIMARRLWPRVSADELASAGYDGLIAAVEGFDPDRGVKFETYCRQRVVGAIRDWQREIDPLGRAGRNFERTVNQLEERCHAETGLSPTTEQLAESLDMSLGKFIRLKGTMLASHCVPLDAPSDRNEDSRYSGLSPVDDNPSPVDYTERELIREYLTRGLKEQDRLIITLYYYERLTMSEIGAVLGVSESRVCQRHAEIVEQLRVRFSGQACDLVA